jgi:hypothetical protein
MATIAAIGPDRAGELFETTVALMRCNEEREAEAKAYVALQNRTARRRCGRSTTRRGPPPTCSALRPLKLVREHPHQRG